MGIPQEAYKAIEDIVGSQYVTDDQVIAQAYVGRLGHGKDTGIDLDHPDLTSKIVSSINFSDSPTADENGHSHGTHAAGIAAAVTNNGSGVAGMGYRSTLMNVKVLGDDGYGFHSWIAEGITWAADNGANVINLSLGGGISSSTLRNAVNYAWDQGVVGKLPP